MPTKSSTRSTSRMLCSRASASATMVPATSTHLATAATACHSERTTDMNTSFHSLHSENKLIPQLPQDVYCFGAPCKPYSRLSSRKRKQSFQPFETEDGEAWLSCARHVRNLEKIVLFEIGCVVLGDRRPRIVVMEQASNYLTHHM